MQLNEARNSRTGLLGCFASSRELMNHNKAFLTCSIKRVGVRTEGRKGDRGRGSKKGGGEGEEIHRMEKIDNKCLRSGKRREQNEEESGKKSSKKENRRKWENCLVNEG